MQPRDWIEAVLAHHRIAVVPMDQQVCVAATELPPVHADPCDRLIIATARMNRWPVATADSLLAQYGVDVVW